MFSQISAQTHLPKKLIPLFGLAAGTLISIPALAQSPTPVVNSFSPVPKQPTSNIIITDIPQNQPVPDSSKPTTTAPILSTAPVTTAPIPSAAPRILSPALLAAPTTQNATSLVTPIGTATPTTPSPTPFTIPTLTPSGLPSAARTNR